MKNIDTFILTVLLVIFFFMYNEHIEDVRFYTFEQPGPSGEITVKALKIVLPLVTMALYVFVLILRSKIKGSTALVLGISSLSVLGLAHSLSRNVLQETYTYYIIESIIIYGFGVLLLGGLSYLIFSVFFGKE